MKINFFKNHNTHQQRSIVLLWIISFFCLSCGTTPTIITDIPTIQPTLTVVPTQVSPTTIYTPIPTASPTQSATIVPTPTETPSPSPTQFLPMYATIKNDMTGIHSGPDLIFPEIVQFSKGIVLEVVGTNLEQSWLLVKIADHQNGWINIEDVGENLNLAGLTIFESPPTPVVTPTPLDSPKIIIYKTQGTWQRYNCFGNCISYTFELRSFKPFEFVTLQIIDPVSNRITFSRGYTMNSFGALVVNYNYPDEKNMPIEYLITAIGSEGSSCSITYLLGE